LTKINPIAPNKSYLFSVATLHTLQMRHNGVGWLLAINEWLLNRPGAAFIQTSSRTNKKHIRQKSFFHKKIENMKIQSLLVMLLGMLLLTPSWATKHIVMSSGFNFVPADLNVTVGDTIVFDIGGSHNAVEVSQATYDARGTASNGGFSVPFGGGEVVITEAKTYYYVCTPHVALDMVGTIVATEAERELDPNTFVADLSGSNEVLPVLSGGSGTVTATLDGTTLTVEGSFSGLSSDFNTEIGAHIHLGYAGQNGGVAVPLNVTLGEDNRSGSFGAADNVFTLDAGQIASLRARQMYVNIHSVDHPSGEIRGQLLQDADAYYSTNLFGSNEVPSIISGAAGALALEVIGDSLFVSGAFSGLEGDLATDIGGGGHLHLGMAGENGGVELPLSVTLNEDSRSGYFTVADNAFELTADQKMMLANRMLYANLHSAAVRPGEIRGQVHGQADAVFRAHLSGSNEAPPVTTAATGELVFELNGNTLTASGSFTGLSGDLATDIGGGAHIHLGIAGRNGDVEFPLMVMQDGGARSGRFMVADNEFTLTDDQVMNLMNRAYYVNIHSATFPAGELRGQIVPESQYFFTGFLTGTQEPDPVLSGGSGAVIAEIMGDQMTLSGSFNNMNGDLATEIGGGSHIHIGLAGTNGPVQYPLIATQSDGARSGIYAAADNTIELVDTAMDFMLNRQFYVNIHSAAFNPGELRAQLLHESTAFFYAPLSGASEAPPVRTEAVGAVIFEWNPGTVRASGSFNNLESDFNTNVAGGAHLHFGMPGQNGGIIAPLVATLGDNSRSGAFTLEDNTLAVSEAFPDTIVNRMVYVNIHSTDIPSGELRGQVLHYANAYFTATLSGQNEVQPVVSNGQGAFKFELNGTRLTATGSFSDLDGDFDPSVGGGSHLHAANAGQNGGVEIGLNVSLGEDSKSGVYLAADNTFDLTVPQRVFLLGGGLYVNIHTTAVRPGEIRGQVLAETNQFPNATTITAPASGADIDLTGLGATAFEASWEAGTDPDPLNNLAYIWQLSADDSFDNPVFAINTGSSNSFVTDFATVSSLLASVGVEIGQTVQLYHRVITSDGSLQTAGPADSVSLTLGVVTDVDDAVIEQMEVSAYPNPATDVLRINIRTVENLDGTLVLSNQLGQIVRQRDVQLNVGENREELNVEAFDTGIYFIQLWIDKKLVRTQRILIQE
jgi:plastocyanin